jgi:uncharacterized protein
MVRLLSVVARPSTRRPGLVLAVLALLTVAFAGAATNLSMETDLAEFGRDGSEVVQGLDRVRGEFDRGQAAVQVIVDAGPGGNVVTPDGLAVVVDAERALLDELEGELRRDADGDPRLLSPVRALAEGLEAEGTSVEEAEREQLTTALRRTAEASPELELLFSSDRDLEDGRARGVTVLAQLDPDLDTGERVAAAQRLQDRLGIGEDELATDTAGVTVAVASPELTNEALQAETQREAPVLLGLALLVVIAVLWLLLRSTFDVAVGLVGLAATIVWTFGLIALTGPEMLGWLGPLSQVGVVVPVLVVGLGIDYAVHLVARYREQRSKGQEPQEAATTAMGTVGAALVLATVATAVGFGVTGTAPLSVIADFGVFTAIGVVSAFLVMGSLVPAARVLRDRRRPAGRDGTVRELDVARVMRVPARLAVQRPVPALALGGLLLAGSLWAAGDLDTSFDRDDFIPADSGIGELSALQQELFDGELTEATYVLVDGDLGDPAVLDALAASHERLADVDHVRSDTAGRPQATSLVTLLEGLPDGGDTPDGDLEATYERLGEQHGEDLDRLLRPDLRATVVELRTNGGDGAAPRLAAQLHEAFEPVRDAGADTVVTSDALIIAEMADDLREFQARSIVITLLAVLALLAGYYALAHRRPMLGVVAMIPSVTSAALLLGTMGVLDLSFDAMTATLTAIAVGIGVPYGVHVTNRFEEDLARCGDADEACGATLATTGGALVGSALTTFAAFAVLSFSGLALIGRMGLLGAAGITYALLAAVAIQPAALVLWARRAVRRDARSADGDGHAHQEGETSGPPGAMSAGTLAARPALDGPARDGSGSWDLHIEDPRFAPCRVRVERHEGHVGVRSVQIDARPGEALTPDDGRQVPLDALIRLSLTYATTLRAEPGSGNGAHRAPDGGGATTGPGLGRRAVANSDGAAKRRLTDEHLARVAQRHGHATEHGFPPVRHVAEEFGVARSTASRWVAAARRRGLLDDDT